MATTNELPLLFRKSEIALDEKLIPKRHVRSVPTHYLRSDRVYGCSYCGHLPQGILNTHYHQIVCNECRNKTLKLFDPSEIAHLTSVDDIVDDATKQFYCGFCRVNVSGPDNFRAHCKGKKHSFAKSLILKEEPVHYGSGYLCVLCSSTSTSLANFEQHCAGIDHQNRLSIIKDTSTIDSAHRWLLVDNCDEHLQPIIEACSDRQDGEIDVSGYSADVYDAIDAVSDPQTLEDDSVDSVTSAVQDLIIDDATTNVADHRVIRMPRSMGSAFTKMQTYVDMLRRPLQYTTWKVDGTQSYDDQVGKMWFFSPDFMKAMPSLHKNIFRQFRFLQCSIKLRFVVASTRWNAGKLVGAFFPPLYEFDDVHLESPAFAAGNQGYTTKYSVRRNLGWTYTAAHCFQRDKYLQINLNRSGTYEISSHWMYNYPLFRISDGGIADDDCTSYLKYPEAANNTGYFELMVQNPLMLGKCAAANVDIAVFVSYEDVILSQLCHDMNDFTRVDACGVITEGTSKICSTAMKVASAIDDISGLVLDKPEFVDDPKCFYQGPPRHWTYGTGSDGAVSFGSGAGLLAPPSRNKVSSSSRVDWRELVRRPAYLGTCIISPTTTVGTRLMSVPISPCMCFNLQGEIRTLTGNIDEKVFADNAYPYIGQFAHMNKYWRGSLEIVVEAVKTSFATFKLQASQFVPPSDIVGTQFASLSVSDLSVYKTQVMDFTDTDTCVFTTRFSSHADWLQTYTSLDIDYTTMGSSSQRVLAEHIPGMFCLTLMNVVNLPCEAAADVYLNFYIRAGLDFELAVPCGYVFSATDGVHDVLPDEAAKIVACNDDGVVSVEVEVPSSNISQDEVNASRDLRNTKTNYGNNALTPPVRSRATKRDMHFGETFDFDAAVKKTYQIETVKYTLTKGAATKMYFSRQGWLNGYGSITRMVMPYNPRRGNPLHTMMRTCVFTSGSLRYRLVVSGDNLENVLWRLNYMPSNPVTHFDLPTDFGQKYTFGIGGEYFGTVSNRLNKNATIEFAVPFTKHATWELNPMCIQCVRYMSGNIPNTSAFPDTGGYNNDNGVCVLEFLTTDATQDITVDIFYAAGDDFCLAEPVGILYNPVDVVPGRAIITTNNKSCFVIGGNSSRVANWAHNPFTAKWVPTKAEEKQDFQNETNTFSVRRSCSQLITACNDEEDGELDFPHYDVELLGNWDFEYGVDMYCHEWECDLFSALARKTKVELLSGRRMPMRVALVREEYDRFDSQPDNDLAWFKALYGKNCMPEDWKILFRIDVSYDDHEDYDYVFWIYIVMGSLPYRREFVFGEYYDRYEREEDIYNLWTDRTQREHLAVCNMRNVMTQWNIQERYAADANWLLWMSNHMKYVRPVSHTDIFPGANHMPPWLQAWDEEEDDNQSTSSFEDEDMDWQHEFDLDDIANDLLEVIEVPVIDPDNWDAPPQIVIVSTDQGFCDDGEIVEGPVMVHDAPAFWIEDMFIDDELQPVIEACNDTEDEESSYDSSDDVPSVDGHVLAKAIGELSRAVADIPAIIEDKIQGVANRVASKSVRSVAQEIWSEITPDEGTDFFLESVNTSMHIGKLVGATSIRSFATAFTHMLSGTKVLRPLAQHLGTSILEIVECIESALKRINAHDDIPDKIDQGIIDKIFKCVLNCIEWLGGTKFNTLGVYIGKHMKGICDLGRFCTAVRSVISFVPWLIEFVKGVWHTVVAWCTGEDDDDITKLISDFLTEADVWAARVEDLEHSYATVDAEEANKLLDRGNLIRSKMLEQKASLVAYGYVSRLLARIETLRAKINSCLSDTGYRVDPFCIALVGQPGVGKSALMNILVRDIAYLRGIPNENLIYCRNQADKFWSGYNKQFAVIADDYLAIPDAEHAIELISLKTNATEKMNMAGIADKGMSFTSKLICYTSNHTYPSISGITDKALWRRRNLLVEICSKHGKPIDWSSAIAQDQFAELVMNVIDPCEPGKLLRSCNYAEFLDSTVSRMDQYYASQNRLLASYLEPSVHAKKLSSKHLGKVFACSDDNDKVEEIPMKHFNATGVQCMYDYIAINKFEDHDEVTQEFLYLLRNVKGVCFDVSVAKFMSDRFPDYADYTMVEALCHEICDMDNIDERSEVIPELLTKFEKITGINYMREVVKPDGVKGSLSRLITAVRNQFVALRADKIVQHKSIIDAIVAHPVAIALASIAASCLGLYLTLGVKLQRAEACAAYTEPHASTKKPIVVAHNSDPNAGAVLDSVVKRNTVRVRYNVPGKKMNCSAVGIFVTKTDLLLNKHVCVNMIQNEAFLIEWIVNGSPFTVVEKFDSRRVILSNDKDLALYRCSPRVHTHKSVMHHFINGDQIPSIVGKHVVGKCFTRDHQYVQFDAEIIRNNDRIELTTDRGVVVVRKTFVYSASTEKGWSGAPLVICDPHVPRKLVGVHTGQDFGSNEAFGSYVTKQMIEELQHILDGQFYEVRAAPADKELDIVEACGDVVDVTEFPQGEFCKIGYLKSDYTMNSLDRTCFVKSPLFGVFPQHTRPQMSYREAKELLGYDPMRPQVEKYGSRQDPWIPQVCEAIIDDAAELLLSQLKPVRPPQLWTKFEAVYGNPDFPYIDSLDMSSSCGFPDCLRRTGRGKACFFNDEGMKPELETRVDAMLDCLRRGERIDTIWVDCKKDQRILKEKAEAGKCRAFSISDHAFSIVIRILCGDFCAAMYNSRIDSFSAVGVNAESPEWAKIFYKLTSFSPLLINGDYGKYDGTIMNEFIYGFMQTINKFYNDSHENQVARLAIFEEIAFCNRLWFNQDAKKWVVYQTQHGNPSGNALTTVLNTFVNACYMRGAWYDIHMLNAKWHTTYDEDLLVHGFQPSIEPPSIVNASMLSFRRNVCELYYGDDNICAVKPEALVFSQHNITSVLAIRGIDYGAATKDGSDFCFLSIDKADFLKREFVVDPRYPHVVRAPMCIATIEDLVMWIRNNLDVEEATQDNVQDACRFAYHHGKQYYEEFCNTLEGRYRRLFHCTLPTWEMLDANFLALFGAEDDCLAADKLTPETTGVNDAAGMPFYELLSAGSQNVKKDSCETENFPSLRDFRNVTEDAALKPYLLEVPNVAGLDTPFAVCDAV